MKTVVVFQDAGPKTVVSRIMHVSTRLDQDWYICPVHIVELCDISASFLNQTFLFVEGELILFIRWSVDSSGEIFAHVLDLLLLFKFKFLNGSVNIVLYPAEILLSGVAQRENVLVVC